MKVNIEVQRAEALNSRITALPLGRFSQNLDKLARCDGLGAFELARGVPFHVHDFGANTALSTSALVPPIAIL